MAESNQRPVKTARRPARAGAADGSETFPIVGIGASAGGLEACRKLVGAVPAGSGMALILIQHLDPTHESMMAELLAGSTPMTVRQASEGMPIERDHLYVIPPGTYLSVADGALHLSAPQERHGARLPFDFLLHSLAEERGARAICLILSGTGADGSLGSKAVREQGGLIIAQEPAQAAYDGMPQSAIRTGTVDLVLPAEKMPEAILAYCRGIDVAGEHRARLARDGPPEWLLEIIDLLREHTTHDFRLYKAGTLQRRTERRMAITGSDAASYLAILRESASERERLAKDFLINVTTFFRDPEVFDLLAQTIIPDLVRRHPADRPLRIWTAGCSTGEETYSLAMLFSEEIAASGRHLKLQVFASDVDSEAIASARDGLYSDAIEANVSAERLARFFTKEEGGYRVIPQLRSTAVFTVQDLLTDPPFSRLDLVSCRNLLIYLLPESQDRLLRLFHFALCEGGILLLGGAETVGEFGDRFEPIAKSERIYRHIGHIRPGELDFPSLKARSFAARARLQTNAQLSDACNAAERLLLQAYTPASVLINQRHECLYFFGSLDRYLHLASGEPSRDLLGLARKGLRHKLHAVIRKARHERATATVTGAELASEDGTRRVSMTAHPVPGEAEEELLLVTFMDEPERDRAASRAANGTDDGPRLAELELELDSTRKELQNVIRDLEISNEEQKGINEEAMSMNEEFQSTNEELMTSKEELQSLNEELTALNSQLEETLKSQRSTSNDLRNILDSSEVATLFLDSDLRIRFFTPAAKSLYRVIAGDIGRPLVDLTSLAMDSQLLGDAASVLKTLAPVDKEIRADTGRWYARRILPYRTQDNSIEGVVILFADITERKLAGEALERAKRQAEQANLGKSRFLAAASHDLRQPLQTLNLLQGVLARKLQGQDMAELMIRLDETLGAMSDLLDTLLDINQLEAGVVPVEMVSFSIGDLLATLQSDFSYHAESRGLGWHVVPSTVPVYSDPRLLEQIMRNLISNAVKYTRSGRVLLGCRRRGANLRLEVWDTGPGIPEAQRQAIFEEFHQLDNPGRDRNRGLGLGLAIAQRLADLLGHRLEVRSNVGRGSVFSVEIPLAVDQPARLLASAWPESGRLAEAGAPGTILLVEDDPELGKILKLLLDGEGHCTATAADGADALELVAQEGFVPDLVIADYNLPSRTSGPEVIAQLRMAVGRDFPAIILTGDISTETLREIAAYGHLHLHKPVRAAELTQHVRVLLAQPRQPLGPTADVAGNEAVADESAATVFVVDDDRAIRAAMRDFLAGHGWNIEIFTDGEAFLAAYRPRPKACLIIDERIPGLSGIELLQRLRAEGHGLPAIMVTGHGDVRIAVQAMKAGAVDFLEKPVDRDELLASITRVLEEPHDGAARRDSRKIAVARLAGLSARERAIMDLVLAGQPSKNIAADLGISQRTVENHRAAIMKKTGAKSLPELIRLALAAWDPAADGNAPGPRRPAMSGEGSAPLD
jgi:two-component system, chemotaxis family, CheB/CheR fusion protein